MLELDIKDPISIYEYSQLLIGHSLRGLYGNEAVARLRKGKGGLGQMVEELFFRYGINGIREADFNEAGVELKCTPLLKSSKDGTYRIKERLVCTIINYSELAYTSFEDSHLLTKCRLMLLLFYLHVSGEPVFDYEFLFRMLWQLPEKDLIQIKADYEIIRAKVLRGEAHLLSEGDTMYLGAARKGHKGEEPQNQPYSDIKAYRRAFSLKPAYMRYVLSHVVDSGGTSYSNYVIKDNFRLQLVATSELQESSFERIIIDRFRPYYGMNYLEICEKLDITPYKAKAKYADISGLIASEGQSKRISLSEEFVKSGLVMKTVRLRENGMPKEAMSFRNIDYDEIMENDIWTESDLYEIFTGRFLFVVFRPNSGKKIQIHNDVTGESEYEDEYLLDRVFFWTMPPEDLLDAEMYWKHIRDNVANNKIDLSHFWKISDRKKFHVRPKAARKTQQVDNPHGGKCDKYCYWFNAEYVKSIIESDGKL